MSKKTYFLPAPTPPKVDWFGFSPLSGASKIFEEYEAMRDAILRSFGVPRSIITEKLTMIEQLEQLALTTGSDNRLILADALEEKGKIKEALAWRWMAEREPMDLTDYSQKVDISYPSDDAWVWLIDGENNCGYMERAKEWGRAWQPAVVPVEVFRRLEHREGIMDWGRPDYATTVKALYNAYLETL